MLFLRNSGLFEGDKMLGKWWDKDIDGCPRHMLWPRLYLLWDWVFDPQGTPEMGIKRYMQWMLRKD
jgi:hypothetical protein